MTELPSLVSPDMAGPRELEWWSATLEAQHTLPELILRLLKASQATEIGVRFDEGVNATGWDGTATSQGSKHLPAGELCFEMGVGKNYTQKANLDYSSRLKGTSKPSSKHFIFVTPRIWAKKSLWEDQKNLEENFKTARVFDAHFLWQWMLDFPEVHIWFSEKLGLNPRKARFINSWWDEFSSNLRYKLPLALFTNDRKQEAEELLRFCNSANSRDRVVSIESKSINDSLAFICGTVNETLGNPDLFVVVQSEPVLHRLSKSENELIFIVTSEVVDANSALAGKHKVIFLIDASFDLQSGEKIKLSPISPSTADKMLRTLEPDSQALARIVPVATRNMAMFLRSISLDSRLPKPEWLVNSNSGRVVAILSIVGAWEDSDAEFVSRLVGLEVLDLEDLLTQLSTNDEPPFTRVTGGWRATAMELLVDWTTGILSPKRFNDVFALIHSAIDTGSTSKTLSAAVCKALILRMIAPESNSQGAELQKFMRSFVGRLLSTCLLTDKASGRLLPLLAEADPEAFLKIFDSGSPAISNLQSFFPIDKNENHRTAYVDLLWALETLACSPNFFFRAARGLAILDEFSGNLRSGNSPLSSLKNLCLPHLQVGEVDYKVKLDALTSFTKEFPGLAKRLVMELWPSSHQTYIYPRQPVYREWVKGTRQASPRDVIAFDDALVALGLSLASKDVHFWPKLIERLPGLDQMNLDKVIDTLKSSAEEISHSIDGRFEVWTSVRNVIHRNLEVADSSSVMSDSSIAQLDSISQTIRIQADPRRFAHLFTWNSEFALARGDTHAMNDEAHEDQKEAVKVLADNGLDDLETLAITCERPDKLGAVMASTGIIDETSMATWLQHHEKNIYLAATSYFSYLHALRGWAFIQKLLDANDVPARAKELLMRTLRLTDENVLSVLKLNDKLNSEFWASSNGYGYSGELSNEVIANLLKYGNSNAALVVASNDDSHGVTSNETLSSIIEAFISQRDGNTDFDSMNSYHLARILNRLENSEFDTGVIAGFEFVLFDLLHDHEPSGSLFGRIMSSPELFVEFVELLFGTDQSSWFTTLVPFPAARQIAFSMSFDWRGIPTENSEGLADVESLLTWVIEVRTILESKGLLRQGDGVIGEILAKGKPNPDGFWPQDAVVKVIESVKSQDFDRGIVRGKINSRGVTSRGLLEGGAQEENMALDFGQAATSLDSHSNRTASILRDLQERYEHEAQFFDENVDRFANEV